MTVVNERTRIEVTSPISGEVIGAVDAATPEDVLAAVEQGRAVQPAWAALDVRERVRRVRRWGDAIFNAPDDLVRIIRAETGKVEAGAFLEIACIDNIIAYYAHHAPRWLRPQARKPLFPAIQRAQVIYHPYGVVGVIAPWNYPYLNALVDLIPALIAGNAIILKPSELTPLTAQYAVEQMHAAGIPADVVQIVNGRGDVGAALIDQVDYVAFTGSTATGKRIAVQAAKRLIPCSLELGGKDPLIVLADADLDHAAAAAIRGAFENAGQTCISVERVYVEALVYDDYVARVAALVRDFKIGAGAGMNVHMGSMTNAREFERVQEHIDDALAKGAKLLHGGKPRPDLGVLFFEPTVLVDVDHTMRVMYEETFGPVLPIMRVSDAEAAVRLANDSEYGLSASIFTSDLKRGERLAARIQSGDVGVNRPLLVFGTPSLPMGGVKSSGLGRRGGREGLMRFVRPQSILTDTLIGSKPALTTADPISELAWRTIRRVRRALPFV